MEKFWYFIWNLSEITGVSLGKYAPFVFNKMIGCKSIKKIATICKNCGSEIQIELAVCPKCGEAIK